MIKLNIPNNKQIMHSTIIALKRLKYQLFNLLKNGKSFRYSYENSIYVVYNVSLLYHNSIFHNTQNIFPIYLNNLSYLLGNWGKLHGKILLLI